MEKKFMIMAYKQAEKAVEKDEVPIGAVIVKDGKVLSKGYNLVENTNKATAHAEIIAIEKAEKLAARRSGNLRYVRTLRHVRGGYSQRPYKKSLFWGVRKEKRLRGK